MTAVLSGLGLCVQQRRYVPTCKGVADWCEPQKGEPQFARFPVRATTKPCQNADAAFNQSASGLHELSENFKCLFALGRYCTALSLHINHLSKLSQWSSIPHTYKEVGCSTSMLRMAQARLQAAQEALGQVSDMVGSWLRWKLALIKLRAALKALMLTLCWIWNL